MNPIKKNKEAQPIENNSAYQINNIAKSYIDKIEDACKRIDPKVVIHCITYNHEPYLKDALEGFIMQKTNFPFVAIVHEDASIDGTADILREYAEKYPDIIFPIFERENQYRKPDGSLTKIMTMAVKATGAEYIAMCEGDDYWIDPLKLQRQVDFLDSHPDYGMCYTKIRLYYEDSHTLGGVWGGKNENFKELLMENTIATLTILIRSNVYYSYINEIVPNEQSWKLGDYPIWLYVSKKHKIKFDNFVSGIYRILPESASHSQDPIKNLAYMRSVFQVKLYFCQRDKKSYERFIEHRLIKDVLYYFYSNENNYQYKNSFIQTLESAMSYSLKKIIVKILIRFSPHCFYKIMNSFRKEELKRLIR